MSTGFEREKLIEVLTFFSTSVKHAGLVKLLKLAYYLDLVHLRRSGRTVTGLEYCAWALGPVSESLYAEVKDKTSDLHRHFNIKAASRQAFEREIPTIDSDESLVGFGEQRSRWMPGALEPKQPFRLHYLTRREYEIAKTLAEIFYEATAAQMSDVSHNKLGPWRKALVRGKQTGEDSPDIDLLEGVVACCDAKLEMPMEQLRTLIAERESNKRALN